ncbi:hypothetical protein ABT116_46280, partial [Streptomyces sp. NPDC002130]
MDGRGETVVDGSRAVGNRAVDIDAEVEKAMSGLGLLAAGANVIMQLARPAVGYGVYEESHLRPLVTPETTEKVAMPVTMTMMVMTN